MKSPLSYLGGKSKLAGMVVEMIPEDHTCYVEAFCGAAWVLFAKERSTAEVINDMDRELVTFWRVVQNHLHPFLDYFKHAVTSREIFRLEQLKRPETLTDIQRAARYYYLQRLAFGGKPVDRHFGTSTTGGSPLNITTAAEHLMEVHWRMSGVVIEHLDALECIRRYDRPHTVFYLDPPYYGLCQDYASKFAHDDFVALRKTLDGVKGRFILSLNDCPEVREIFDGFKIKRTAITYTVSNGRNDQTEARAKQRGELLIHNIG